MESPWKKWRFPAYWFGMGNNMKPLPCPFCGNMPRIVDHLISGMTFFGVVCREPDCAIGNAMILKYEDSDSAIEWWNRRAK